MLVVDHDICIWTLDIIVEFGHSFYDVVMLLFWTLDIVILWTLKIVIVNFGHCYCGLDAIITWTTWTLDTCYYVITWTIWTLDTLFL